jgi:hypothetical protein
MIFDKLYYIIYLLFNCCKNNIINKNNEQQQDNSETVFNVMCQNDLFYWHNIYKNNNSLT